MKIIRTKMGLSSVYYHSLFCLTLRAMSEGGFRTTIHSMIVVAADKAYLIKALVSISSGDKQAPLRIKCGHGSDLFGVQTYQVKMY